MSAAEPALSGCPDSQPRTYIQCRLASDELKFRIIRMDVDGKNAALFMPNSRSPTYSPDGKSIVFAQLDSQSKSWKMVIGASDGTSPHIVPIPEANFLGFA